jgi:hypothetical protein
MKPKENKARKNNSHTDFSLKQLLNFGKRWSETGTLLLLVWWTAINGLLEVGATA